eukprot:scaffold255255_cov26-Prasinocladus_malaysianus.AAC.1
MLSLELLWPGWAASQAWMLQVAAPPLASMVVAWLTGWAPSALATYLRDPAGQSMPIWLTLLPHYI